MLPGKKELAHERKPRVFRNSQRELLEVLREHLEYQNGNLLVVERFGDAHWKDGNVKVFVKLKIFNEAELDRVTLSSLQEDVPDLVQNVLDKRRSSGS